MPQAAQNAASAARAVPHLWTENNVSGGCLQQDTNRAAGAGLLRRRLRWELHWGWWASWWRYSVWTDHSCASDADRTLAITRRKGPEHTRLNSCIKCVTESGEQFKCV